MDLYRIIRELVLERDRLTRIIDSLEEMKQDRPPKIRIEGVKRRGRKSMDRAARQQVSDRMKRYWAQRRSQRTTSANGQDPESKS
jgi:hypothetical protein